MIDTPGFCSTSPDGDASISEAQDKQNINLILNQLGQYPHIDAFVILLKPGQEKLDPGFATSLKTLFSQLDESAKNNVVFSFTHSSNCNFNDIQHLPALSHFLKNKANLEIKRSNVYYFDNSPFCYLATAANNYQPTENRDKMQYCWNKSVKNCIKMLVHINKLAAHKTDTIVAINDSKAIIKMILAPLVYVCKVNEENYGLVKQTFESLAKETGRSVIKVKHNENKAEESHEVEMQPNDDLNVDDNANLNPKRGMPEEELLIKETNIDTAVGRENANVITDGHEEEEANEEKEANVNALGAFDLVEIEEKILTYKKLKKPITVCNNPACFEKQRIIQVNR